MANDHNFKVKNGLTVEAGNIQAGHDGTYGESGTGRYVTVGFGGISNGSNRVFAHNTGGDGLYIASASGKHIHFRTNGGGDNTFTMTSGGSFRVGGTDIITSARNLTNIGTISSGTVTSSGNFVGTSGHVQTAGAYFSGDIRVLNSGGTAWNTFAARSNGIYNLASIGTISSGNITAGNSSTAASLRAHYNDGSYMTLVGYGLEMNRGASYIRPTTDGNKTLYIGGADDSLDWNAIHFRSSNGLYMTGTQFLDTNRNLTNIGSVSASSQIFTSQESSSALKSRFLMGKASGSTANGELYLQYGSSDRVYIGAGSGGAGLTVSGSIAGTTGYFSGKFAVMTTGVHGSYDFYNNGTSYFNGAVTVDDNLTVAGNLTVQGTTTTIDTANLNVEDNNITLNYSTGDSSSTANGAGITIQDAVNSSTDASMTWSATNDRFVFSHPIQVASIHSGSKVSFLDGSSAQGARFGSIYVGTTYANDGSSSGTVDTLNGYKVGGTTVISSNAFTGRDYIRHKNSGNVVMTMNHDTYTMLRNPLGETRLWMGSTGYNGASSDNGNYYNASTHYFRSESSAERARINTNGVDARSGGFLINGTSVINSSRNIHNIGTISATGHLDISNPSGDSLIRIAHGADNSYDAILEFSGSASNIAQEGLQIWYDNNVGDAHFATTYAHDDAYLRFHTRTGATKSTSNERLTIAGHGTVGINKSSGLNSSYKLHMGGHIHMDNNHIHYINQAHFNQGTRFIGSSASTTILRSGTSTNSNWLSFQSGSDSTTRGYVGGNSDSGHSVGLLDQGGNWAVRHINDQGTIFYSDNGTEQARIGSDLVSGDYGGMVLKSAKNGYVGYSLNDRAVFMHNNSTVTGIYNDVGNEWYAKFHQDGAAELYHNGYRTLFTQAPGAIIDSVSGQSTSQIHFRTNGTSRGYVYSNTSNDIGFLDAGGDWAIRHVNDQGTEFRTDGSTVRAAIGADLVSGNYGSMVVKEYKGSWAGYSIDNNWVFMSSGASAAGLYNDTDNKWALYMDRNAGTHLYYNGSSKLSTNNSGISVTGEVNASASLYAHNKKVIALESNSSSERGPWNPIVSSIRSSGRMLYKDEEFWTGSNSVGIYNNAGGGTVAHTREADTVTLGADAPNGSGMVIRIYYNGGTASPGFGGFVQSIPSEDNHTFVQIFQAKLPSGKTLQIAENQQGSNNKSYFLTSNAGTGKWEWYARVSHCGDSGTFSSGGHIYVAGGSGAFTWYLASCTVYDVTEHPVASKLELFNDRRNLRFRTDSTGAAGLALENATGTFRAQLYGEGSQYGFLASSWGNWDIRKNVAGKLFLNNQTTYFIQPEASDSAKFFRYVQIGDSSSYGSNSGTWGARLNVTDDVHAKIEVGQDADSMLSHWYAHTGHSSIKFGTASSHDVEFQRAGSTSLEIEAGGIKAFVPFRRSSHHASGFLEGSYNNVGANAEKTNPIYTIGSSYNPAETTLSNMYGIGFSKNTASFMTGALDAGDNNGWGLYVAADGDARIFLNASDGIINSTGQHYANSSLVWNAGNDGSGSGLDADTLDGLQATSFVYDKGTNQITTASSWDITAPGMYGVVSSSAFTGTNNPGISGIYTYGLLSVFEANGNGIAQLYTPHTGNKIALRTGWNNGGWYGWQQVWTSTSDGSGSGLDADTLDGYHGSNYLGKNGNSYYRPDTWIDFRGGHGLYWGGGTGAGWHIFPVNSEDMYLRSGSTNVALRLNSGTTARGYVYANSSNQVGFLNNSRSWRFMVESNGVLKQSSDGSNFNTIWHAGNDGDGSGLDADLLDGVHKTSFVRTDASSTILSGNQLSFQTSSGNTRGMIMASESIPHMRIATSGNESIGFYDGGTSGTENVRINGSGGLEIYNSGLYMQNASTGIIYSKRGSIKWDSTTASSVGGFIDRHGSNSGGLNTDAYPSPIYSIGLSYLPSGTGLSNHYGVGYAHTNASFYSLSGQSGWGFYVSADGDARVQLGGGNGTISCTGNVVAYASDGRLKTNVKPIENALDKVMKIRGVEYDWVENITTEYDFQPTEMHEVGVIAQEVQEVLPEVVREAPFNSLYTQKTGWSKIQKQMEEELGRKVEKAEAKTKYEELPLEERQSMEENYNFLTVDYERIVPLLIEGIKELKQEVDDLKAKLKEK